MTGLWFERQFDRGFLSRYEQHDGTLAIPEAFGCRLDHHLTSGQHAWLLKQANSIFCTCGCRGDTIARCVVLDPTCQTARQVLDKMASTAGQLSEEELKAAAAADREAAAKQPAN